MTLLDTTRDIEAPDLSNSQWEGYAVDTNDPDQRQRVRVRIPLLHRGIPDSELPFANSLHAGAANAGAGVGQVNVPEKGSKLIINMPVDDPHILQYSASPASDDVNKDNELLKNDYPNTYGHIDSYGNRFSLNRATGEYTIGHRSGTTIYIDGSGNVSIASAGDLSLASKGNIAIAAGGKIKMSAGGDIELDGANVELNQGSADAPQIPDKRPTPQIPDVSGKTDL